MLYFTVPGSQFSACSATLLHEKAIDCDPCWEAMQYGFTQYEDEKLQECLVEFNPVKTLNVMNNSISVSNF